MSASSCCPALCPTLSVESGTWMTLIMSVNELIAGGTLEKGQENPQG